jgi:hypothetical protein
MQASGNPDEARHPSPTASAGPECEGVILFTGAALRDEVVLAMKVDTIEVEPDLSVALGRCFEGKVSCLLVDLGAFGSRALTAVAQMQLIRPQQKVVLLQRESDPASLQGTLLEGLPQIWTRSRQRPAPSSRRAELKRGL